MRNGEPWDQGIFLTIWGITPTQMEPKASITMGLAARRTFVAKTYLKNRIPVQNQGGFAFLIAGIV
jgi:hypothetical protein